MAENKKKSIIKKFQEEARRRREAKKAQEANETEYDKILKKLNYIERELKNEHALGTRIYKAVIAGVFGTFGATIVFALIIFVLALIIDRTENIPIINDFIEKTQIAEILNDYNTLKEEVDKEVEEEKQEEEQEKQEQELQEQQQQAQ